MLLLILNLFVMKIDPGYTSLVSFVIEGSGIDTLAYDISGVLPMYCHIC